MNFKNASKEQSLAAEKDLANQFQNLQAAKLSLDLTRGKPSTEQVQLSDALDGILAGNYIDDSGTDLRNYGGLDGIPAIKSLFADAFGLQAEQILVAGNSSLSLMHQSALYALQFGLSSTQTSWIKEGGEVKFLCPVPGYDRHFSICEHLGIKMIPVAMDANGPVMDEVEALVKADPMIKGMWCVPRFSNPTGCTYSDETVDRIAALGTIAGDNFRVFWDNAYALHIIDEDAAALSNIFTACEKYQTQDSILYFGSTSKVTFAGAGVAFLAASDSNLNGFRKHMSYSSIGPDKINQQRHVNLLKDVDGFKAHMSQHAQLIKPRFDMVEKHLSEGFADTGIAEWTKPEGGYFVSFNCLPGLAKNIIAMSNEAGVKLTPAGAAFPYGQDPQDSNIRLAPTFPSLEDVDTAMAVFVVCVKLATVRQLLDA